MLAAYFSGSKSAQSSDVGYLFEDLVAVQKKAVHVALEKEALCQRAYEWEGNGEGGTISHFCFVFEQSEEGVIVLHEFESALGHRVLEVIRRVERSDFAREVLAYAKVFCAPPHRLARANQTRSDSAHCFLS
jgi:hypothetical protein